MARYFIESVRYGVGEGGFACGPVDGPVVAEIKVKTDNEEFFMSLAEVFGLPNFYKSKESLFDILMNPDINDETIEDVNKNYISVGDYESLFENKDLEWFELYRYLIYVVRADYEKSIQFIENSTGRCGEEITIPASDIEYEMAGL